MTSSNVFVQPEKQQIFTSKKLETANVWLKPFDYQNRWWVNFLQSTNQWISLNLHLHTQSSVSIGSVRADRELVRRSSFSGSERVRMFRGWKCSVSVHPLRLRYNTETRRTVDSWSGVSFMSPLFAPLAVRTEHDNVYLKRFADASRFQFLQWKRAVGYRNRCYLCILTETHTHTYSVLTPVTPLLSTCVHQILTLRAGFTSTFRFYIFQTIFKRRLNQSGLMLIW